MSTLPILLADDDNGVLSALRLLLKSEKLQGDAVQNPAAALSALKTKDYALLIMDMNYARDTTSGSEGLSLIEQVRALDAQIPIIVMTGWGTLALAVEAMRLGANDFVEKPFDNTRLMTSVRNLLCLRAQQLGGAKLQAENALLKAENTDASTTEWAVHSPAMQTLLNTAGRIAATDVNVLLTGANGTGKSQFAQWLHAHSQRADKSFISINMGAVPEQLFESELFGHVKGAFTDARDNRIGRFELADGGTLFFDEVGNLPLAQQAKLLRVLESGQFEKVGSSKSQHADVRIIAATNADLNELVRSGRFRQDLLYRLQGIALRLPSLTERAPDILPLAQQFLQHYAKKYARADCRFSSVAEQALLRYDWPGNVRELRHGVERAVLLALSAEIQVHDLQLTPAAATTANSVSAQTPANTTAADEDWSTLTMEAAEQKLLHMALRKHGGNAVAAAQALGLSRSAFYRRLEKFDALPKSEKP